MEYRVLCCADDRYEILNQEPQLELVTTETPIDSSRFTQLRSEDVKNEEMQFPLKYRSSKMKLVERGG